MSRSIDLTCTIEIEQTHDSFHAHLTFDDELAIGPGDRVKVHGAPLRSIFGQRLVERRQATVTRAGWMRRAWTRLSARFEMQELYEVSFTPRRSL